MSALAKEQIERVAYALWEKEGRPNGRDVSHYLEAERTLTRGLGAPADAGSPAGSSPQRSVASKSRRSPAPKRKRK